MSCSEVSIDLHSNSKEIEVDPNLPIITDKEFYVNFYENIQFFLGEKIIRPLSRCYNMYPKTIGFTIFLLIFLGGICGVMFGTKTNNYPCVKYTNTDLASSISKECINYLWTIMCSSKRQFDPSNTWWTNSPQGQSTIKCDSLHTDSNCGAGNYGAIVLGIQLCNPHYTG